MTGEIPTRASSSPVSVSHAKPGEQDPGDWTNEGPPRLWNLLEEGARPGDVDSPCVCHRGGSAFTSWGTSVWLLDPSDSQLQRQSSFSWRPFYPELISVVELFPFVVSVLGRCWLFFLTFLFLLMMNQNSLSHGRYHSLPLLERAVFLAFSLMQLLSSIPAGLLGSP